MTTKQRAMLRGLANTMDPVLHIGKDGITDNLVKQAWDALEARELIKVTVQKNARGLPSPVRADARGAGAVHRFKVRRVSPLPRASEAARRGITL